MLVLVGRVATCKPGKPGLTSFSETLAFFFIQFISFRKMKVQERQNGPSKSFRAYQKKLAGYAPVSISISVLVLVLISISISISTVIIQLVS